MAKSQGPPMAVVIVGAIVGAVLLSVLNRLTHGAVPGGALGGAIGGALGAMAASLIYLAIAQGVGASVPRIAWLHPLFVVASIVQCWW